MDARDAPRTDRRDEDGDRDARWWNEQRRSAWWPRHRLSQLRRCCAELRVYPSLCLVECVCARMSVARWMAAAVVAAWDASVDSIAVWLAARAAAGPSERATVHAGSVRRNHRIALRMWLRVRCASLRRVSSPLRASRCAA